MLIVGLLILVKQIMNHIQVLQKWVGSTVGTQYDEHFSNFGKNYECRYLLSSIKVEFISAIKTGVGSVGFKNDDSGKYWIYHEEYQQSLQEGEK